MIHISYIVCLLLIIWDLSIIIIIIIITPNQASILDIPSLDVSLQDGSEPSPINVDAEITVAAEECDEGKNIQGRNFGRDTYRKYSLEERTALGQLCQQYKNQYEEQVVSDKNKVTFNTKKRKHTNIKPKVGWASRAVRDFYPDLKGLRNDDPICRKAKGMAERSLKMIQNAENDPNPTKAKFRQKGGGRNVKCPEVGDALYAWFIDIRGSLKACLPINIFREQAKSFYREWLQTNGPIPESEMLKFSDPWIFTWMKHHHVSLKQPNKRYSISSEDRKERITEYIKNIWLVRKYFLRHI